MAYFDTSRPVARPRAAFGTPFGTGPLGRFLSAFVADFLQWRERRQTVDALSRLSDRELSDIGLTRSDLDALAHGETLSR